MYMLLLLSIFVHGIARSYRSWRGVDSENSVLYSKWAANATAVYWPNPSELPTKIARYTDNLVEDVQCTKKGRTTIYTPRMNAVPPAASSTAIDSLSPHIWKIVLGVTLLPVTPERMRRSNVFLIAV